MDNICILHSIDRLSSLHLPHITWDVNRADDREITAV